MTRLQTIELLKSQLPGFYSAEQVINLLEKMEVETKVSLEDIQTVENKVINILKEYHRQGRVVEEDDIEISVGHNGRELEVSNVNIDFDVIRDAVTEALTSTFPETESED